MRAIRQGRAGKIGTSIGALAVLFLTLAAPLHHAHALQDKLTHGNYGSHGVESPVSDCSAHGAEEGPASHHGDRGNSLAHCPVCSLGKMASALIAPTSPAINAQTFTTDLPAIDAVACPASSRYECPSRPRAPPVTA